MARPGQSWLGPAWPELAAAVCLLGASKTTLFTAQVPHEHSGSASEPFGVWAFSKLVASCLLGASETPLFTAQAPHGRSGPAVGPLGVRSHRSGPAAPLGVRNSCSTCAAEPLVKLSCKITLLGGGSSRSLSSCGATWRSKQTFQWRCRATVRAAQTTVRATQLHRPLSA